MKGGLKGERKNFNDIRFFVQTPGFTSRCRRKDAQMESSKGVVRVVITYAVYS